MKRYELYEDNQLAAPEEDSNGHWVRYEDAQALKKELTDCRDMLTDLLVIVAEQDPQSPLVKKVANWLANWDGERL